MKCPICKLNTQVLESRQVGQRHEIRRRRQCKNCRNRFTTYEKIDMPALVVVKRNGYQESFDRRKIARGIMWATKNTKLSKLQVERLVDRIESAVFALGKTEVKTQKIGNIVIKYLATTDKVAYLRFVSVYRRLKTVASLERELSSLKK